MALLPRSEYLAIWAHDWSFERLATAVEVPFVHVQITEYYRLGRKQYFTYGWPTESDFDRDC